MFRFRPEVMFAVLALLVLSAEVGVMWPYWVGAFQSAVRLELTHVALAMAGTAVLVGVVSGIRRSLPNYAGAPPVADLVRILVPFAVVTLLAAANIMALSTMLGQVLDSQTGRIFALQAARAMSLGVIGFALYHAALIIVEFRRDVAWDRRMHPHQYQ